MDDAPAGTGPGIASRIEAWAQAGLIDRETAERLLGFERERGQMETTEISSPDGTTPPSPPGEAAPAAPGSEASREAAPAAPGSEASREAAHEAPPAAPHALAVVGEIVGYLGAVLVVSAVTFLIGNAWEDLNDAARVGVVAALTIAALVAGLVTARYPTAPAQRLASALLAVTVGLTAWLAWLSADSGGVEDPASALIAAGAATAVAAAIYAARRRALAQMALLAGILATATALYATVLDDRGMTMSLASGLTTAAIGAVWIVLSALGRLVPEKLGLVIGGLTVIYGLQTSAFDDARAWVLAAAVACAVAMIVAAITRRDVAVLIVPGGIGLLTAMPQLIEEVVEDAFATWLGVLATGVLLVVAAVWMVRDRTRRPSEAPPG
ncbi:DUF2157 domain-containing protein [Demequina pelophila]|uniref:DUF2157 domain-containing protein n=1 Tax=Demequina pelophila TaxID=1638984 RepID=UPI000785DD0C|nr:DUF2157 domain-containing protein [Demequina pelophila]